MTDLQVRVDVSAGDTATLTWTGAADPEEMTRAFAAAAENGFAHALRRIELSVPATDSGARRAALRSGFRREGVRRRAVVGADGSYGDVWLFARLAEDPVGGPTGFSSVMNTALPRKRLIAHVLIRDPAGRILLCETRFKSDWELPGGIVEPLEPPRVGALREVVEELGVDRPLGRLLVADWMPPYLGWEDALELIFDGGEITEPELAGLTLQPSEIIQVRLCTLAEAAELVTPLSHRRLTVACALAPGEFAYLEDGVRA